MIESSSIVIISNLDSEYRDILIQRLVYRINRVIKPKLLIIIDDEKNIPDSTYTILNSLKFPFFVVKDKKSTPFTFLTEKEIPDFNKQPYSYLIINTKKQNEVTEFNLSMDKNLELQDQHIHTQMAYCSDNMDIEKSIKLGKLFGLESMTFTEHSGQLYFNSKEFNKIDCYKHNISITKQSDHRMEKYLKLKEQFSSDFVQFGLELDFDFNGQPIIDLEHLKNFDFILGTMHVIPEINAKEFMLQLERVLKYGIDVIAHPFRIFRRNGKELPMEIITPSVELLKKYNTAAEINCHTNEPPTIFLKECLRLGVKFSLGSDSHNLAEIGDFSYNIQAIRDAGYTGDIKDIIWNKF